MGERAKVKMFGKLFVEVHGSPVRIRTKPAQSLFVLLCLDKGKAVLRTRLAESIWNDLEYSISGNRLRTTLVILKQALFPWDSIHANRSSIWIDADSFDTDLSLATEKLNKVRVLQDLDEELETHHQLLDIIDQPFLMEFVEPWALEVREMWCGHRSASLLRVAQIQENFGFLVEALNAVERVFVRDDYHPQAWMKYLRLMAKADRSNEALTALAVAQGKMRSELDAEFDRDVLAVANQVRHGSIRPSKSLLRFSSAEKTVLIGALEKMATTAPDEFLTFLASSSFGENIFQRPATAFNLIVDALGNATEKVDLAVKGSVIQMGTSAAFTLSYHKERESLCRILIDEYPEESELHSSGLAQLAFLRFEQRDFATATELAKLATELSRKYRPDTYNRALESSSAACHWHLLQFAEADAIYESLLVALSGKDDYLSQYNTALINANWAFMKSVQLDWGATHDLCLEAKKRLVIYGFEGVGAAIGALFGCANVMLGIHGGRQLISDGLKDSYRQQNLRVVEIGLDYAACALVKLGLASQGLAVMNATTNLRDKRQHARSAAEQLLADSILADANGATPDNEIEGNISLLDAVLYACKALEHDTGGY